MRQPAYLYFGSSVGQSL